jgi:hypothetical protein
MLGLRRSGEVRRINGRTAQSDDAAWSCPKHQHDDVGWDCADRTKHAMRRGSGAAVLWGKRGGCCCCIFWAPARGSCRGVAPMGAWLLELHRRHESRELLRHAMDMDLAEAGPGSSRAVEKWKRVPFMGARLPCREEPISMPAAVGRTEGRTAGKWRPGGEVDDRRHGEEESSCSCGKGHREEEGRG